MEEEDEKAEHNQEEKEEGEGEGRVTGRRRMARSIWWREGREGGRQGGKVSAVIHWQWHVRRAQHVEQTHRRAEAETGRQ